MRIVSQDGTIDVSYENGSLVIGGGKCKDVEVAAIFYYNSSSQRSTKLAEYKSKAKVIKAMEMLRRRYKETRVEEVYHDGLYSLWSVFQFPKDEDLEVDDET